MFLLLGVVTGAFLYAYSGTWVPVIRGETRFEGGDVLFVGDIMLGRSVERLMEQNGMQYPFAALGDFLFAPDATIGNFEASIPEVHMPTPNFSFSFSVRESYMSVLKEEGFDALSLANNHALNHGEAGYAHTRNVCASALMVCFGHPTKVSEFATAILEAEDTRIGIIGLHTLFAVPDMDAIQTAFEALAAKSDIQIAYIHWGDEYEPEHNAAQEKLAHALIDMGIDAIVGHHPHVVQDVEIYEGKPIFYSLGNFIFDQYWSAETQEGMALRLSVEEHKAVYELIPLTSLGTKSQPHLLPESEAEIVVEALLRRSKSVEEYVQNGKLVVSR